MSPKAIDQSGLIELTVAFIRFCTITSSPSISLMSVTKSQTRINSREEGCVHTLAFQETLKPRWWKHLIPYTSASKVVGDTAFEVLQ